MRSTAQPHGVYETAFPSDPASVMQARWFVSSYLLEHHLFYLVDDVRLAVSELATNAVRYARSPFTVALHRGPSSVTVRVEYVSYAEQPIVPRCAARLLEQLTCRWGIEQLVEGTRSVWATFGLGRDAGRRPASCSGRI